MLLKMCVVRQVDYVGKVNFPVVSAKGRIDCWIAKVILFSATGQTAWVFHNFVRHSFYKAIVI